MDGRYRSHSDTSIKYQINEKRTPDSDTGTASIGQETGR